MSSRERILMVPADPNSPESESSQQPVYLLCKSVGFGERLALDLRHHGLRVRSFVNADVLANAARRERPVAVVLDVAFAGEGVGELLAAATPPEERPLLFFLGRDDDFRQRLQAVRAGGNSYFPLPVNRTALLHQLRALGARNRRTERILVVDGREGRLAGVADTLTGAGWEATYLDQAQRVVGELEGGDYALLLIADVLDDMRGTELLQVVRQSLRFHTLPAIILTAAGKQSLDDEATDAGADALLGLPVAAADLIAVVRARLSRAQRLSATYAYIARHDAATGLFNEGYFFGELRRAVADAAAGHGRAALAWLDLKVAAGATRMQRSAVLSQLADTLTRLLPPLALPARVADGLAILLPDPGAAALEDLLHALDQQLRELERSVIGKLVGLRVRVGTTLLGPRHKSANAALTLARQAAAGESDAADDTNAQRTTGSAHAAWAGQVRDALRANRFRLVYQPIARLSGEATAYYEVFMRMLGEDGRDILPQEFLPAVAGRLAEELDRWVLARAVHVLESRSEGAARPVLFVKLLPDSIDDGAGLIRWLGDRLQIAKVAPSLLVLQIRQQTASTRPAETRRFLGAAREAGCRIALEHFTGSHEAGLQLLQTLRPDFVRLTPELTRDIAGNREHQKRVEMITSQCRSIGAHPIAALVQDALSLSVLWRCGVEYVQGYFMQEPADLFADSEY